ncbi:hypothetical protein [Flavobacterium sp.]|uniref:hypothetical protein n=1 Tax=Flavobacterium sp. TaxID=239 RepID=UPI00260ED22E|nr:hypothetical protein [Flavobacterium sp.]
MKEKFETILIFLIVVFPIILLDIQSEFFQNQTLIAMLINSVSFIILFVFIKSLRISNKLTKQIIVLFVIWLCILPVIFYKIYSRSPESFAFNKEYLISQKQFNSYDFDINENNFLRIKSNLIKEINTSIFKKALPQDSDTLILLKNYIILSPYAIHSHGTKSPPKTFIKLYDKLSGKFLIQFEKKSNLIESYNYFNNNINFKIKKVKKPEIGITYFDFWCSSVIGFRDNLIIPLRNWIVLLDVIFITIIFTPIFDYIKKKYFNHLKNNVRE